MDVVFAELVSFLEALKSGSPFHYLILLAVVVVGLALTIAAVAYQRVVIKRSQTASKAAQENFEAIAADLRKRALEVKKQDEGLRKGDLETECRASTSSSIRSKA
jgi:Tfp pilus assembly protein PilE